MATVLIGPSKHGVMTNRILRCLLLSSLLLTTTYAAPAAVETYDLVIAGGRVIDPESGLDAVRNIGIQGDRIASMRPRATIASRAGTPSTRTASW